MSTLKGDDVRWVFEADKIMSSKTLPIICGICSENGHSTEKCKKLNIHDIGFIPSPKHSLVFLLTIVCYNIAWKKIDVTQKAQFQVVQL